MANNSDIEIWKDIPNYEGCYQASNLGKIRSLDRLDSRGHKLKGRRRKQEAQRSAKRDTCN